MDSLARAVAAFRRARDGVPRAERDAHAERAIDAYLAWCEGYAAGMARKSEREAARYLRTGEPASVLPAEPVQVKPDRTHVSLHAYRAWLAHLSSLGLYTGSVNLKRMRPDGTWEELRVVGESTRRESLSSESVSTESVSTEREAA